MYLLSKASRPALGPSQPPVQRIHGFFLRNKAVSREDDHLPSSSADDKNEWSCLHSAICFIAYAGTTSVYSQLIYC